MARGGSGGSDTPKTGRLAQIRQVFTATRQADPTVVWWMLLGALATVLVMTLLGLWLRLVWVYLVLAVPLAVMVATIILMRRAERAAYRSIEGKAGAAGAALSGLRRGWYYDRQPVAADATRAGDLSTAAMVYRAVGRPGVVLVSEGPKARAIRLAEAERKKVARVLPGVQVTVYRVGDDSEAVPVRKLARTITRLRPVLTKQEAGAVNKRLRALGATARPPIPAGVDPSKVRPDRRAMRGR
ncbi:MAG TPA: DUF4191 domain-containing protein [Dermatophilaceae bacterium]|nr:DUF4191 domain-containing protein [Dermatophilaceae bacterium]